jgi:hypothetical protein
MPMPMVAPEFSVLMGGNHLTLSASWSRVVLKKCRPDWDITSPELKTAWKQGRKEFFYPYGKTYIQTLGEQELGVTSSTASKCPQDAG